MFSKCFWLKNFCVDGNNSAPSWRMNLLQSWNRRTRTVKYDISSIRTNCALSLFGLYVAINPIIFHCFLSLSENIFEIVYVIVVSRCPDDFDQYRNFSMKWRGEEFKLTKATANTLAPMSSGNCGIYWWQTTWVSHCPTICERDFLGTYRL